MTRPTPIFLTQVTALTHEPPFKADMRRKYVKIAHPLLRSYLNKKNFMAESWLSGLLEFHKETGTVVLHL